MERWKNYKFHFKEVKTKKFWDFCFIQKRRKELEEKENKKSTVHSQLYGGLQTKQARTFPIHASLKETVLQK